MSNSVSTIVRLVLAAALLIGAVQAVRAQVPTHAAGTICATAYFWCWANPPGVYGHPCACSTADGGSVPGTYI
jgi:hypothetical protein